ncbi:MAG: Ig-like domain-containing protein, partial [Bdellovibrionales bacterium]
MRRFRLSRSTAVVIVTGALCSCGRPILLLSPDPKLREVQVSCELDQVPANVFVPCEAIGIYSDGHGENITLKSVWRSSDASIVVPAQQTHRSWVRGVGAGAAEVIAEVGSIQGSFPITVNTAVPISLAITPANQTFRSGLRQIFNSVSIFSDSTYFDVTESADWQILNANVGEITTGANNPAQFTAKSNGTTTVEAAFEGIVGSTSVTVLDKTLLAVQINPSSATVIAGLGAAFTATGIFTDLSTADLTATVTWSVIDGTVGSISNTGVNAGRFSALAAGTTKVMVTTGGFSDDADVTVTSPTLNSVTLSPANTTIPDGTSVQFQATGSYSDGSSVDITEDVVWFTSDMTIASINNVAGSRGEARGQSQGTVTISASLSGVTGQTFLTIGAPTLSSLAVTPATSSVAKGLTQQYLAQGTYSDGSVQDLTSAVSWTSTDTSLATVSNVAGT